MKNSLILLIILVVIVGGVWVLSNKNKTVNSSEAIKIGGAFGLSGECATWGEGERNAVQLAVDEVNNTGGIDSRKIELVIEDTRCDSKGSVSAIKKLLEVDRVGAIIGPTWGDSFQAGALISNTKKIVSVFASGMVEAISYNKQPITYIFSAYFPASSEMEFLSKYILSQGVKSVYVIHDNDPFGELFAEAFKKSALLRGIKIEKEDQLPIGYDDFRTIIATSKNKNIDAVYVSFQAPASQAKFLKQAKELGLNKPIFSLSDMEDSSLLKDFGFSMEGVIYAYPDTAEAYAVFQEKYKKSFNTEPGPSSANAYDAMRIMIAGLTEYYKNGTELRKAIENINMPGTFIKQLQFDSEHKLTGFTYKIKTVRNGKFVVVE